MSVTYTAALPVRDQTVLFLSSLLHDERRRRGTRTGSRALSPFTQAVLILRWFLDNTRVAQLACDNTISKSTAYDYLHEGITLLAARAPKLESALLAAKIAGHDHISIDGTLIETDRCRTPGPTLGVDLWWSGKHASHGGNIQVITAPDGWPLWTSDVRPGREHDTTALRTHTEILPVLAAWTGDDLPVLGDLGYEGEAGTITVAFKKPQGGELTEDQKAHNKAHNAKRAVGERGNSLLKTTFKALRNVSLCPWAIGEDPRGRSRAPAHRPRPHHMITQRNKPLRGKAQCLRSLTAGRQRRPLPSAMAQSRLGALDGSDFPGGRLQTTLMSSRDPVTMTTAMHARVADTRFVLDRLTWLNVGVNPDAELRPLPDGLRGALDLCWVGMFGHS